MSTHEQTTDSFNCKYADVDDGVVSCAECGLFALIADNGSIQSRSGHCHEDNNQAA